MPKTVFNFNTAAVGGLPTGMTLDRGSITVQDLGGGVRGIAPPTVSGGGGVRLSALGDVQDFSVSGKIIPRIVDTSNWATYFVEGRNPDGNNVISLGFNFGIAGGFFSINKLNNGAYENYGGDTRLLPAGLAVNGVPFNFRIEYEITSIRMKVWADAAAEPSDWTFVVNDAATTVPPLTISGPINLGYTSVGNPAGKAYLAGQLTAYAESPASHTLEPVNNTNGEHFQLLLPTAPFVGVVYLHVHGNNDVDAVPLTNGPEDYVDISAGDRLLNEFTSRGCAAAVIYGAGNSWGNNAAIAGYENFVAYCRARWPDVKFILNPGSMGGIVCWNLFKAGVFNAGEVLAVQASYPSYDLAQIFNTHNGLDQYIRPAYGLASDSSQDGTFAAAVAGHDPNLFDPPIASFPTVPYLLVSSPADTVLNTAANTGVLRTRLLAAGKTVSSVTHLGDHGDPDSVQRFTYLRHAESLIPTAPYVAPTASAVTGISITAPTAKTVYPGGWAAFMSTVAGTGSFSAARTWSKLVSGSPLTLYPQSDDSVLALVSPNAPVGSYQIQATSDQDGSFTATATITVQALPTGGGGSRPTYQLGQVEFEFQVVESCRRLDADGDEPVLVKVKPTLLDGTVLSTYDFDPEISLTSQSDPSDWRTAAWAPGGRAALPVTGDALDALDRGTYLVKIRLKSADGTVLDSDRLGFIDVS